MTLTPTMIQAQRAQATGEVFLELLTLDHPSFDDPVRLVRDNLPITHQSLSYLPFQFSIIPPERTTDGAMPILRLSMQNVDQSIIRLVRSIASDDPITVTLTQVLRSEPNAVQRQFPAMQLRRVPYSEKSITGEIVLAPILEMSISKHRFTPSKFKGLF